MESERAPWIIGGAIVVAGLLIAIAVFLSRTPTPQGAPTPAPVASPAAPTPETSLSKIPSPADPAHDDTDAQKNLRDALGVAQQVQAQTGSYALAGSFELAQELPELTYQPSVRSSNRPDALSLANNSTAWAAAAQSESGTCFWIKDVLSPDGTSTITTYGIGTPCSGNAAMASSALVEWPS